MNRNDERTECLTGRCFIHIPGPNPIVVRGTEGEWDEACIEAGDIFKDYHEGSEKYYLYYHGTPKESSKWPRRGYRIGLATAAHPLGPFTKVETNPILDLGPQGSWDDAHVACPCFMKQGSDQYIMWYSGRAQGDGSRWSVGLATASHPLGPWQKYDGNPILKDFGYVGSVVQVGGAYYMYTEYPIGATGPDYGPFALAVADSPYGPWRRWEGNPILSPDGWGAWDDGGYSEAKVVHSDGVFHVFYGAAKLHPIRIRSRESIGYAFSTDGYHFVKCPDNPVALIERVPDASAFAEVQCLLEPPLIYLYHTLRYFSSPPGVEDLGMQVLAVSRPFSLTMPVLSTDKLAAGEATALNACPPINLESISRLAITAECKYHSEAKMGMRVHVRASKEGSLYDTADWHTFDNDFLRGRVGRRTVEISPAPRFVKVMVENLDQQNEAENVVVTATLGG